MEPTIVTIVQARVGSNRFPSKVLKPLAGQPMILHVLERARAMGYLTWMATTTMDQDEPLGTLAVVSGYPVYRGHQTDVLARMADTAVFASAEIVVRVTGDCPLFAPDVGRLVVDRFLAEWAKTPGRDIIVTNDTTTSGWPDGLDVEVFPYALLMRAQREIPTDHADKKTRDRAIADREHVTPWMRRTVPHYVVACEEQWQKKAKLSVDVEEDFATVAAIMGDLRGEGWNWPATRAALMRQRGKT